MLKNLGYLKIRSVHRVHRVKMDTGFIITPLTLSYLIDKRKKIPSKNEWDKIGRGFETTLMVLFNKYGTYQKININMIV